MSSKAWKTRQQNDPYVKRAREEGYRARAAYKLMELDEKDQLFKGVQRVVDLGAAPGSWSQIARKRLGQSGTVIALDLLPMEPIAGVVFIEGDFREDDVLAQLESALGGEKVDLVLSDYGPQLVWYRAVRPGAQYPPGRAGPRVCRRLAGYFRDPGGQSVSGCRV